MQENNLKSYPIFVSNLLGSTFSNHQELKQSMVELVHNAKEDDYTNRKGFITTSDLQHHPVFEPLIQTITNLSNEIKKSWELDESIKLGIQQMYGAVAEPGGTTISHEVPYTFLHGMYFLNTPPDAGNLIITHPADRVDFYANLKFKTPNLDNTFRFETPMPEGDIIFLPGYLKNHTSFNDSNENRIVINFSIKALK